jgi:hypothetical protein
VAQLTALAEKEGKKKIQAKIRNRIRIVKSRKGYIEKVVAVESAE